MAEPTSATTSSGATASDLSKRDLTLDLARVFCVLLVVVVHLLMVGVDTQVVHGFLNCGAVGAITGIGNALPTEVLHLVALCRAAAQGDPVAERRARELDHALHVLSSFDEGVDLVLHYKYLMVLAGYPEYALHFNPGDALSDSQRRYTEAQWKRFRAWWAAWSAVPPA